MKTTVKSLASHLACSVVMVLMMFLCLPLQADEVVTHDRWRVTYVPSEYGFKFHYQREDGTYRPIIIRSMPEANYLLPDGTQRSIKSGTCSDMTLTSTSVTDEFGTGVRHDFTFSGPNTDDDVQLVEHIWCYESLPYLLVSLELVSNQDIRSNYLSPVNCGTAYVIFTDNDHNRMLKIPFDNDGFLRYDRYHMNTSMTSYEVSAFYEGDSRNGLVVGSVDHKHWKSAVKATMSNNGRMDKLSLYSGVANSETRDKRPHGYLEGQSIQSARFMMGFFDDWRDGMETFTAACNIVQPKRDNWVNGRPVGWMTWNVMEAHNNYTDDKEVFQYFADVLQPAGFHNGKGKNIMSIDAWSGLNSQQEKWLIAQADTSNQIVGCYGNPFCLWWDTKDPSCLEGTYYQSSLSTYKAKDVVLYANGEPLSIDGAYCLDPTHPAVKAQNASWIKSVLDKGYRYMKLDFVTNGCVEADSYYNKKVHTGKEAYNEGFAYFVKQVEKYCTEPVYIDLSISPLFPYHYANGRRQACDTWGTIGWTEYSMNAITAGWWTNGLYQYNDPDGLPMVGHGDQGSCTMGENRSRLTSGIVSGHVFLGDNFSTTNQSGRGNPTLSKTRAKSLLMNPEINELLALDPYFRPVKGYDEYGGNSNGAENFVMMETPEYYYVVVINYHSTLSRSPIQGTLSMNMLGIDPSDITAARELWMGTTEDVSEGLKYSVPSRDCRIYRLTRQAHEDAIQSVAQDPDRAVEIRCQSGQLTVSAPTPIRSITLTDLAGRRLQTTRHDGYRAYVDMPRTQGVVIATVTLHNGTTSTKKIKL